MKMAPVKVAINGAGRIGRLALRLAWAQPDAFELVHINDVAAVESVAYLVKYDSVHGACWVLGGLARSCLLTLAPPRHVRPQREGRGQQHCDQRRPSHRQHTLLMHPKAGRCERGGGLSSGGGGWRRRRRRLNMRTLRSVRRLTCLHDLVNVEEWLQKGSRNTGLSDQTKLRLLGLGSV